MFSSAVVEKAAYIDEADVGSEIFAVETTEATSALDKPTGRQLAAHEEAGVFPTLCCSVRAPLDATNDKTNALRRHRLRHVGGGERDRYREQGHKS